MREQTSAPFLSPQSVKVESLPTHSRSVADGTNSVRARPQFVRSACPAEAPHLTSVHQSVEHLLRR